MKRIVNLILVGMIAAGVALAPAAAQDNKEEWKPLFDGKDLSGWETWLGKPNKALDVPGVARNEKGEYSEPVGLNKDPKGVFTVLEADGKPAVRISGEIYGAMTTKEEFANYHFKMEFKWGRKKWPPREDKPRHSGLLYHGVGPHGAGGTYWMRSFECQIQERDCGDFWSVDRVIIDVEAISSTRRARQKSWARRAASSRTPTTKSPSASGTRSNFIAWARRASMPSTGRPSWSCRDCVSGSRASRSPSRRGSSSSNPKAPRSSIGT